MANAVFDIYLNKALTTATRARGSYLACAMSCHPISARPLTFTDKRDGDARGWIGARPLQSPRAST